MRNSRLASAFLGGVSILAASAALAQTTTETPGLVLDPSTLYLGEIVIYGDRTAETLGDSNASVGVVRNEQLSSPLNSELRSAFSRIANARPGDFNESGFILRGVNSEGQTPGGFGTPLASYYIDGVQQTVESTRRGARGLFDMEQLEVYRGPQSTLSGRAALAGAIYLRSVAPTFERDGHVQLTYGENNHRQVGVAFGDALGDNLAFRVSGEWSERESDLNYPSYEQYALYDDFITDDYRQFRARLLWTPNGDDSTQVLFSYAHSVNSPFYNSIAGPGRTTYTGGAGPSYGADRGDVWGELTPLNAFGQPQPFFQDLRETTSDSFGIEVTHEFSDLLTLTAHTGWNRSVTDRQTINTGSAFNPFVNIWDGFTNQTEFDDQIFSQEVRLNYDDGSLRWVAGIYGAREERDSSGRQDFSALALLGGFAPALLGVSQFEGEGTITNYALFGELGYEVTPGLTLIAGGRWDYFENENSSVSVVTGRDATGQFLLGPNGTFTSSSTFEDSVFIPKLGVEYEFGEGQRVAFIYQQGYRPGGSGMRLSDMFVYDFDPETTHNYEISYRGRFMDDRLSVAASVFYQDWSNQQVEVWATPGDPSSSYIVNAGDSLSYGAELELGYAASDNLDLFASIGVLETEFENFVAGANDYSGLPFPAAPRQNVAIGYSWQSNNGWFSSGVVTHVGDFTSRLETGVTAYNLDAYTVADLEIGYAWDNGASLTAYADNLFDERYFVYEAVSGGFATLGARREVGLRLDYRF